MQETQVWSPTQEDPLVEATATHCSVLAWEIPWTEESGGLETTGSQSQTQVSTHAHHIINYPGLAGLFIDLKHIGALGFN